MSDVAQACPVCGGRGWMEAGFFTGMTMATSLAPETCRPCSGTGLIWRSVEERGV